MLDELKILHQRDKQDALGCAAKQIQQYLYDFKFIWQPKNTIYDVIVSGVGVAAVTAKAYKNISGLHVPMEIVQGHQLPDWADENSLLVCASYSGDDAEVLRIFEQAVDVNNERSYPKPMIIVITSGGELLKRAKKAKLPIIELPVDADTNNFGYFYRALAEVFGATPLVDGELKLIEMAAKKQTKLISNWSEVTPTKINLAKQLALELIGKSAVIYSGPMLAPVAKYWKIQINTIAKHVAFWNQYPDIIHNELIGWEKQPAIKLFTLVELRSELEFGLVSRQINVAERYLSGMRPAVEAVDCRGTTWLEQMMYAVALGKFVSIYLAILNNVSPAESVVIDKLRQITE